MTSPLPVVRWLLERHTGKISDEHWELIYSAYTEPHRHYHSLQHIEEMLVLVETNRDMVEGDLAPLYAAIVYHDIVYDPVRQDNEDRSADLLRRHFSFRWVELAAKMVLDTINHQPKSCRQSGFLIDADLARFSAAPAQSKKYNDQIRAEYSHVPDLLWREGRAKALLPFLAREPFYHTPMFSQRNVAQARQNIVDEISRYL